MSKIYLYNFGGSTTSLRNVAVQFKAPAISGGVLIGTDERPFNYFNIEFYGNVQTERHYYTYGSESQSVLVTGSSAFAIGGYINDYMYGGGGFVQKAIYTLIETDTNQTNYATLRSYAGNESPAVQISGKYRFNSVLNNRFTWNWTSSSLSVTQGKPAYVGFNVNFEFNGVYYVAIRFLYDFPSRPVQQQYFNVEGIKADGTVEIIRIPNGIIDFGANPQDVPKVFYDWFIGETTYIYPYTYTIKNYTDEVLATMTEMPPIRNVTISTVGNTVNVALLGSNDVTYNLSYSRAIETGKTFLGLSYSNTDRNPAVIPNQSTPVTWDRDTTLYDVIGEYRPPTTTFNIELYQNTAESERIDKTNYLTSMGTLLGALRSECSIIKPSIVIEQRTLPTFNYVYIPIFSRYYFVTGITSVNFGLWRIDLNTDVLMTYQTGIKALTAIIGRQENDYNDDLIDTEVLTEKEPTVTYQEIPNSVLTTQGSGTDHNFVITVVGA